MAFLARDFADPSFTPLFRLLSDWDAYTQEANTNKGRAQPRRSIRTFTPKFDIREVEAAYELHGELPGISKEEINIEFSDPQTITIRGHVDRHYTSSGSPSAGGIDNSESSSHKAFVEDEKPEEEEEGSSTAIAKKDPNNKGSAVQKQQAPRERFLIQERSVGEFSRTFVIPTPVDHDAVHASFTNGILTVILPKAKKPQARQIAIH
ncbi:putative 30 kDa heat shock protein [Cladorrhinum sp. PSN332]|nr:putative 30 kDa heat shock protein [Cladorrhinum sp. PSN332]